ncbi:MAG: hypothetical protein ACREU6_12835 [Steroidobacteraceae bacterium]
MSNVHPLLPKLIANRQFIQDLCDAEPPCFAMGLVEERRRACGFLALRVGEAIPTEVTNLGFSFGHGLLGTSRFEVILFSFHFYGFETYHVLVNPNNALVRTILSRMLDGGDYFVYAVKPKHSSTAFRADMSGDSLFQLRLNWDRIKRSTTSEADYQMAVRQFRLRPNPPGQVLEWVCRDNIDYLDLAQDRLDMRPLAERA